MGTRPRNRGTWHAGRRIAALTTVVALLLAPVVVILTHGPAAHAAAADMSAEVAAHGHAHGERADGIGGGLSAGHDATDHEHQLHALIVQSRDAERPPAGGARRDAVSSVHGVPRDGPKRPPRTV